MITKHRALVVEDDPVAAAELAEILESVNCLVDIVDNRSEALARLERSEYCIVTLDLEIRLEKDSIKGHREHGNSLLRDIRQKYQQHVGLEYSLPVIVISGFAREKEQMKEVLREGAADVVEKPFKTGEVSHAVRRVFERGGRATHDLCGKVTSAAGVSDADGTDICLAISGKWAGSRVTVSIGSRSPGVTHNSLRILLRLMAASFEGTMVHARELGYKKEHGYQGIPRLRKDLGKGLAHGGNIIVGDKKGSYGLADSVRITQCNAKKLEAIGDGAIVTLAKAVEELLKQRQ